VSDDLDTRATRWIAAERSGDESAADDMFRALARAVPYEEPPLRLAAAIGRVRRRVRWRRAATTGAARAAGLVATLVVAIVTLYAAVVFLGPFMVRLFMRGVETILNAVVWLMVAAESGIDTSAILMQAGRTLLGVISTSGFATSLVVVEIVAALALYALYRLLSQEKESVR
jgi:hypothetical protein